MRRISRGRKKNGKRFFSGERKGVRSAVEGRVLLRSVVIFLDYVQHVVRSGPGPRCVLAVTGTGQLADILTAWLPPFLESRLRLLRLLCYVQHRLHCVPGATVHEGSRWNLASFAVPRDMSFIESFRICRHERRNIRITSIRIR